MVTPHLIILQKSLSNFRNANIVSISHLFSNSRNQSPCGLFLFILYLNSYFKCYIMTNHIWPRKLHNYFPIFYFNPPVYSLKRQHHPLKQVFTFWVWKQLTEKLQTCLVRTIMADGAQFSAWNNKFKISQPQNHDMKDIPWMSRCNVLVKAQKA